MRLLHTADWHLGRSFHGASLLDAQHAAAEHVVAVARAEGVDAIVLAGDVTKIATVAGGERSA